MELLLLYEAIGWEQLFWKKFKAFLNQIGNVSDRVEEKERLTREWKADCWRRLNPQMHAALKRLEKEEWFPRFRVLGSRWASFVSQLTEGVETPLANPTSLSELREEMDYLNELGRLGDEARLRMEKEIEDTEFRLKRGSELGRFDQFWDDNALFECRYRRSKWLYLSQFFSGAPLEIYSHVLKQNKNIIHITFSPHGSDSDVNQFQATFCELSWVTSISRGLPPDSFLPLPAIDRNLSRDPLFIKSALNNDLITFAKEIRLKLPVDDFSTYIFTDAGTNDTHSDKLGNNAKVLISFVAPTSSGQSLMLRLKHSGEEDGSLEVTLGSTRIQLNHSSKSSLTIDDITLYPIPGPSESHHLSFEPGIRNEIFIQFRGIVEGHDHFLHDIDLLDEVGGLWRNREI